MIRVLKAPAARHTQQNTILSFVAEMAWLSYWPADSTPKRGGEIQFATDWDNAVRVDRLVAVPSESSTWIVGVQFRVAPRLSSEISESAFPRVHQNLRALQK